MKKQVLFLFTFVVLFAATGNMYAADPANVFRVINTANSGAGSFRQAQADANTYNQADAVIVFDESLTGQTINLSSGRLVFSRVVSRIEGNGAIITSPAGYSNANAHLDFGAATARNLTVENLIFKNVDVKIQDPESTTFLNCQFIADDARPNASLIIDGGLKTHGTVSIIGCSFISLTGQPNVNFTRVDRNKPDTYTVSFVSCSFLNTAAGNIIASEAVTPNGRNITLTNSVLIDNGTGNAISDLFPAVTSKGYNVIKGAVAANFTSDATDVIDADIANPIINNKGILKVADGGAAFEHLPAGTAIAGITFPEKDITGATIDYTVATHSGANQTVFVAPAAPVITNVSPSSAKAGDAITITGTSLAEATVTIDGKPAAISANTATSITVTVPKGVSEGDVVIVVTTEGGSVNGSITIVTPPVKQGDPYEAADITDLKYVATTGLPEAPNNVQPWEIKTNLQVGDFIYVDRHVEASSAKLIAEVPEEFLGQTWISTSVQIHRYVGTDVLASFKVNKAAEVIVMWHQGAVTIAPDWLTTGWTWDEDAYDRDAYNKNQFGVAVFAKEGTAAPNVYWPFRKHFAAGSTVELRNNGQNTSGPFATGRAPYWVVVLSDVPTAIEEVNTPPATVWPNPFADYVIVNAEAANQVTLYDLSGRKVLNKQVSAGQNRIDLPGLNAGVYLLKYDDKTIKLIRK
ncbi:hypothetical protein FACS189413_17130 [Bacteroidia bacterium]|nr:hypothetical protein FACS189413_17130 [Bacteroidia bacterium]